MHKTTLFVIAIAGLLVGGMAPAFACTWSTGTEFSGTWETVRMPAAGPLVLDVDRYSGPGEEEPFESDELTIRVLRSSGESVPGEFELVDARFGQRIYWRPDAPLEDLAYTLEASDGTGTATADLEVVDVDAELPVPGYRFKGAREDREPAGPEFCCNQDQCVTDSCGFESCGVCWHEEVEYLTRVSIDVFIPADLPTGWIETRQYRIEPDGSRTLFRRGNGSPTFSEDAPFPRCVEVALYDRVRDIESATEVCIGEDDIEEIEHEPVDNSHAKSLCVTAGEEVDPDTVAPSDDEETDEEPPPGWEFAESPSDGQSGCCSTLPRDEEPGWAVIFGLLAALSWRRRRRASHID